jgi:hypothetical protein
MRLIHTTRFEPREFFDSEIPEYAILSHCWVSGDEISYQDLLEGAGRDAMGWRKIEECCRLARNKSLEWAWIDTCCIDKKSSAELQEAINSMFRWYENSKICYAFLSDASGASKGDDFPECRWFKRGWTLQELLAPATIEFYDRDYRLIGTRDSLAHEIVDASKIDRRVLTAPEWKRAESLRNTCVARKMSWASRRQTAKVEDLAYCLLGLFDVNMPLLYGEGQKAFLRLQQQIISKSFDESIFVWTSGSRKPKASGLLAHWPSDFAGCGKIRNIGLRHPRRRYRVTERGVEMTVLRWSLLSPYYFDLHLDCAVNERDPNHLFEEQISVRLQATLCRWITLCGVGWEIQV